MNSNDSWLPDTVLPEPLLFRLADAGTVGSAPADRVDRMRQRLLDRVRPETARGAAATRAPADAFITLRGDTQHDEGWVELLPKAHAKLLFTDGTAESYMIRLEPGAWAPAHEHPADEECLVLEGTLWQGDVFLKAGDFHVARPGMKHGELRTDTGALVFIRYARPLGEYIRL
jgi:quercetin dioxygenase-like cupin family protein